MGREVSGRMWEFMSITGKPLTVTDDEVKAAYEALFSTELRELRADKESLRVALDVARHEAAKGE